MFNIQNLEIEIRATILLQHAVYHARASHTAVFSTVAKWFDHAILQKFVNELAQHIMQTFWHVYTTLYRNGGSYNMSKYSVLKTCSKLRTKNCHFGSLWMTL